MAADKQLTGVDWKPTWLHLQQRTVSCQCARTGQQAYTAPAGPPPISVYSLPHTHCTPHPLLPCTLSMSFGLSRRFIGLEVVCCVRVALHSGVVLARRRRRRGSSSRPGQCKVKAGSSSQQRFSPAADLNCQTQTGQRAAQPCLIYRDTCIMPTNINHHSQHKKWHKITSFRRVLS